MLFGIYYPYWEREWGGDAFKYIVKAKHLGFDVLEVPTAGFEGKPNTYFRELRRVSGITAWF